MSYRRGSVTRGSARFRTLSPLIPLLLLQGIPQPGAAAPLPSSGAHFVQSGDTLWSIARQHALNVDAIARANELAAPDRLQIGQRLIIPTPVSRRIARRMDRPAASLTASARHVVAAGETLWSISQQHGLTVDALVALNVLPSPDRLQPGQTLVLRRPVGRLRPGVHPGPARPVPSRIRGVPPAFAWPSRGVLTSRFGFRGRRHHHGIDIAAPVGTPIGAAQAGVVQFTGWREGYGLLVIIDNGGGLTTWYGHASRLLVRVGQRLQKGQVVARIGTTGHVTGPNLHFEVRRNDVPLDPLKFLRSRP